MATEDDDVKLDGMLRSWDVTPDNLDALTQRIMNELPDQPTAPKPFMETLSDWLGVQLTPAYLWGPASGLAAAAVLGFWIGISGTMPEVGTVDQALLLDPVFYETTDGLDRFLTGEVL